MLGESIRPPEQICMLRTLVRDKRRLVEERADWIGRMQKSLDQMNVRVHRAVSDIQGNTGMKIIQAIESSLCYSTQTVDALAKAHSARILHRVTGDGHVKVLDFTEESHPPG